MEGVRLVGDGTGDGWRRGIVGIQSATHSRLDAKVERTYPVCTNQAEIDAVSREDFSGPYRSEFPKGAGQPPTPPHPPTPYPTPQPTPYPTPYPTLTPPLPPLTPPNPP